MSPFFMSHHSLSCSLLGEDQDVLEQRALTDCCCHLVKVCVLNHRGCSTLAVCRFKRFAELLFLYYLGRCGSVLSSLLQLCVLRLQLILFAEILYFCASDFIFPLHVLFFSRDVWLSWPGCVIEPSPPTRRSSLFILVCSAVGTTEGLKRVQFHKAVLADKQGTFLGH